MENAAARMRTFVCDRLAEGTSAVWAPWGSTPSTPSSIVSPPRRRGPLALSDPLSQAPKAAPGETLARYDQRPRLHPRSAEDIEARADIGHWKGDLLICKRTRPVLVLHERKSHVTLAARLTGKTAAETISVMLAVFGRINPALRKSITFDNDTAFAQHALLRTMRDMATWFSDAYASCQKGGVENANGRLRRWLPRHIDIDRMSDEEIQDIVITANLTPRKCLGFQTP
jgi:IS30 family transposase